MKTGKRLIAFVLTMLMVLSCWVWYEPVTTASAATLTGDSDYLFAYFTGTSIEGQTIHLAVSQDGLNYTALRNNDPVIVPSKGTGCVRDPYLWYNENDGYYYILATDLDFTDTGSDYSDNSESFIVWRSKDLVNWYDETMIDVKAILGRLGINNNNMQAVWAPQVLWDGTDFVVYFSLQCDATSNGYWNPLTIVYLKTKDLLDESQYGNYGVIHNPGRHVIDADIIKKPGTNQYYMFYKDESASGGIQSIYYMISDNGPTGPYYAPNNANDGRGPQLFATVGKNLEGCNSFFDDNGNLITYVDEYDYVNAAGQKEAHFHVSRSSDFSTYTTLSDSSHNINSLSPRHGSVVKITREEYNRLLSNSDHISSSSFSETDNLKNHLVGRYFTTPDYTYNAANGKKDLTKTDGTISAATDASGSSYAHFNAAGAEINLAQLINGEHHNTDLNIKDGFTITFSAMTPTSLGSNARFFDISNNWSQRTNPSECYLHMSPVADNNGLYVGAYNGPVTTSSWTWASQGRNYNDGAWHDYIISFADGNLILYIDGELAMKRDRYNMNAEYGDNFLNDNWYKAIGNSVMRIGKSEWSSDPLFTGEMKNLCIYDCSLSYYDVQKMQKTFDAEEGKATVAKLVVPETVYMKPSTGTSTQAQYYVNNNLDINGDVSLKAERSSELGYVAIYSPGMTKFRYDVSIVGKDDSSIKFSFENKDILTQEMVAQGCGDMKGYIFYPSVNLESLSTGLSAGSTATAEWKFTLTYGDGSQTTHYAYTTLYAPWYQPVGASAEVSSARTDSREAWAGSIAWFSGVHGYTSVSSGTAYYPRTDNFIPMLGVIKAPGNNDPATNWIQSSASAPYATINYVRYDGGGYWSTDYHTYSKVVAPKADITIDTSRYNNLNQIPNLTVGFLVTDYENDDSADWYLDGIPSKDYGWGTENVTKNDEGVSNGVYNSRNAQGQIGVGSGTATGVKYNGTWNKAVTNGELYVKAATKARETGAAIKTSAADYLYLTLNVNATDKTKLRNLVLKSTYFNESDYTANSWKNFKDALELAAKQLGNPTVSDVESLRTDLEAKINALQTTVKLNANGGTINGSATTSFDVTVGDKTSFATDLSGYVPVRKGYEFMGWATSADAESGSTTTVTAGFMPTFYATWKLMDINVTFDNLIDLTEWFKRDASNAVVSNATETGFTLTSVNGTNEGTYESHYFPVTPGKQYEIDIDFAGDNWDVYIFFCDANGNWIDFADMKNRYSSNGSTGISADNAVFTAPNKTEVVKAKIRVDANGANNSVTFSNIRVYENTGIEVSPVNKVLSYGSTLGTLPTPTRAGYVFLGWFDANGKEYTSSSKMDVGATLYLTSKWERIPNVAKDDTVVIDYGASVEIDVLANDIMADDNNTAGVTAIGTQGVADADTGDKIHSSSALTNGATSLTLKNGKAVISNGKVTYTPTTTNNPTEDWFFYEVKLGNNYYYAKVTVIPATTIYYEDTFFTFADSEVTKNDVTYEYKWTTVGEVFDAFQSDELDEAYGFDSAYDGQVAYSGGNVHYTTVDAIAGANGPTATFTFTGTGFDLFTVTDYESGMVTATVYRGTQVDAANRVQGVMANAYFGYDYDGDAGQYVPADNGAIYQVPIIKAHGLAYGTYTVVVMPRYNKSFDVTNAGNCKVYVDSVRIYNPMGENNDIANDAYMADGEFAPEYLTMRDTIVQANNDGTFGTLGTGTSVYLDGGKADIENYLKNGPKGEVYLGKGNSIAFNIVTNSNVVPTTVQLGMRTTGISGSEADVKLTKGDSSQWLREITLNSTTERYYSIDSVVDWTVLDDGTYKTAAPIVITNNSDAIISLTALKWAFDGTGAQAELFVMSDEETPAVAMFAIRRAVETEEQQILLDKENISFSFSADEYNEGDSGVLTVVTEQGIATVTVNGTAAISNGTDENGKMIWTYEFVADEAGNMKFEIIAAVDSGLTSEAIYAATNVNAVVTEPDTPVTPDEPDTPDTPDEPDTPGTPDEPDTPDTPDNGGSDDSDNGNWFTNFIAWLSGIYNKVVSFFNSMFTYMMGGVAV